MNSNETAWSTEESAVADKDIIFYESFERPVVAADTTGTNPEDWDDLSTGGNGASRAGLGNTPAGYSNYEGAQAAWLNVYNSVPVLQTTSANFSDIFVPSCDYRFGTSAIATPVTNASLDLTLSTNAFTVSRNINVNGITAQNLDEVALTNGLPWANAPASDTASAYAADSAKATLLGTIAIQTSDARWTIKSFSNQALIDFLNADTNDCVTFMLSCPVQDGNNFGLYGDTAGSSAPTLVLGCDPVIGNLAPDNITASRMNFNASLAAPDTNYAVYVHWGLSDAGTNFGWDSSAYVGSWTNAPSTNITYLASGLTGGVTNWYTFRASNDAGNAWAAPSWRVTTLVSTDVGAVFMFK